MERDSCVFYRSFYEAIDDLEDADKLACYNAIFKYALNGEEPTEKGIVSTVFKLVRPLIDKNNESYKNGLKGGRPKTEQEPNDNPTETQPKPNNNPNEDEDVDVNENVDKKERAAKRPTFVRPTVEEVRAYCQERKNSVDAEAFIDFYASKGWKVGNQTMKDWKAAVRTWEKRDKPQPKARQPSFSDQRTYDYDDLERRLLAKTYGQAN